jgi:Protein of unknown function (DUF2905)
MSGRTLIYLGLAIVLLGLLWLAGEKLGFGRLPGDIEVKTKDFTLHVPIVSAIVVSLVLTLLFNLFRR